MTLHMITGNLASCSNWTQS